MGADFHEIVLLDSRENSVRRFAERTRTTADPVHADAHEMVERDGGSDALAAMYDRLLAVIAVRPAAKIVRSEAGQPAETYSAVLGALSLS